MKISPSVHGILDFLFVLLFQVMPAVLDLSGVAALVCYAVAIAHLGVSLLTRYPVGVLGIVPFPMHGVFELALAVVLIAAPCSWTPNRGKTKAGQTKTPAAAIQLPPGSKVCGLRFQLAARAFGVRAFVALNQRVGGVVVNRLEVFRFDNVSIDALVAV